MGGIGVALAIVVGLLSSFIQSLGLTIQRKSHIQNDALPLLDQRRPIRRPLWLLGFGIYIVTNISGTIFQLDALPIVILAPLGAVSLIYNALLARLILGDRFGVRMVGGTALVGAGAVLIAVFGVVEEGDHPIEELLVLWGRPAFLAFFWVVISLTLIVLIVSHVVTLFTYRALRSVRLPADGDDLPSTPPLPSQPTSNYASPHDPPPIAFQRTSRRWSAPLVSSQRGVPTLASLDIALANGDRLVATKQAIEEPGKTSAGEHTEVMKRQNGATHTVRFAPTLSEAASPSIAAFPTPIPTYAEPTPAQQKTIMTLGLSFAAASGVISGMSLVLAKAAVELLIITLEHYRTGKGANQFQHPQSWLLVAGLAIGGLAQLVYLNYSLTFASPALICPLAFCFFNLSSIFDGLVFYDQFSRLQTHQIVLVSVGVGLLLVGVWVVSVVEPTGQGGVDMGTWVEEEDDESTGLMAVPEGDHSFLEGMGGGYSDEPTSGFGSASDPSLSRSYIPSLSRPDILRHDTFPFVPAPDAPSSPSPMSPTSPRRKRVRYGTLLPELAPVGAPTGFSIGLGAASPGFVLRPGPLGTGGSSPLEGRSRSRSEGARGIQEIMSGAVVPPLAGRGLAIRNGGLEIEGGGAAWPIGDERGPPAHADRPEDEAEEGRLRRPGNPQHFQEEPRGWSWTRLFRRQGRIRLQAENQ